MPLGQRIADMASLCRSSSRVEFLRAPIGDAKLAQELLLATDLGRVQPLRLRDSLPVYGF